MSSPPWWPLCGAAEQAGQCTPLHRSGGLRNLFPKPEQEHGLMSAGLLSATQLRSLHTFLLVTAGSAPPPPPISSPMLWQVRLSVYAVEKSFATRVQETSAGGLWFTMFTYRYDGPRVTLVWGGATACRADSTAHHTSPAAAWHCCWCARAAGPARAALRGRRGALSSRQVSAAVPAAQPALPGESMAGAPGRQWCRHCQPGHTLVTVTAQQVPVLHPCD